MNEVFVFPLGYVVPLWGVVAGIVAALLIIIAAFFLIRGGGKKKDDTSGSANDWQGQSQMGAPGGQGAWNQQNPTGGWNQQQQPGANAWGNQQQQQPSGNPWGNQPATTPANPWGNQPATTPANPWGNQQQQPATNPWAAQQQQPATSGSWDNQQQQPAANPWGNQPAATTPANPWGNQQQQPAANPWGAQAPTAAAQDAWNQPQQAQQSWGSGKSSTSSPLQGSPSFGGTASAGPAWNQPAQADNWGTAGAGPSQAGPFSSPPSNPGISGWQQQQGGFGQQGNAGPVDNDKTILRPGGPGIGSGMGYVRVEEGKEPGRIYEVRKESLSIGRSRESDIFLEDLAVSRLHASIVNMGNSNYALKDEGSANGTKVNGQLVNKFQTYPLQEGDRIQLGQTVLVFARR